ncbi:MAG TPA: hypothetical protein VFV66_07640 [Nonomuraea sp.]|nr:hypothetical protein [Nonomuraea sp.]
MTAGQTTGWSDFGWDSWKDLALVRARLDAGADPDGGGHPFEWPLHAAAGLRPVDDRALTSPRTHLRLPDRDYWGRSRSRPS